MSFKQKLSDEFIERLDNLKVDPLEIYKISPDRIREDFGTEETALGGGYSYRQITELIQNGADAISEYCLENSSRQADNAKIEVILTKNHLYAANTGASLSGEGLNALLRANSSPKRGIEIGRFGLGFKSLLRLGGTIELYSATNGNIYFDPHRCKKQICDDFNVKKAPGLRLVWPLNNDKTDGDEHIEKFGEWAETLVRAEIKKEGYLEKLKDEMRKFQQEFLLFLPVSVKIVFKDLTEEKEYLRELSVKRGENNRKDLFADNDTSTWRYFENTVSITDEKAISDATHIHKREVVPIAWAYPAEGRAQTSGRFWAFFPTETESRTAGIINAPWKLNSDRTALVSGDWNNALIGKATDLIAENLSKLANSDDPGGILNAFPRQVENQDEIAGPLVEGLWQKILSYRILPNGNGEWEYPDALLLPPLRDIELVNKWFQIASREVKAKYVHASCLGNRERASRLDECARRVSLNNANKESPNLKAVDYKSWIESIATMELAAAKQVILLADECRKKMLADDWSEIKFTLKIIPSADKKHLLSADEAYISAREVTIDDKNTKAILIKKANHIATDRILVMPELAKDQNIRKILIELGVKEPDDSLWLETLDNILPENAGGDWERFWETLRICPSAVIKKYIDLHRNDICVKRNDNEWVCYYNALLPGGWVNEDDEVNTKWLVDLEFHNSDAEILEKLGVKDEYDNSTDTYTLKSTDDTLKEWREEKLNSKVWEWKESEYKCPLSIKWLLRLPGNSRAAVTVSACTHIINNMANYPKNVDLWYKPWDGRRREDSVSHENPVFWLLERHGTVKIGQKIIPLFVIIGRKNCESMKLMPEWRILRPIIENIPSTIDISNIELNNLWEGVISMVVNGNNVFDKELSVLWLDSCKDEFIPNLLPASRNGSQVPLSEIYITTSEKFYTDAMESGINVILLNDKQVFDKWQNAGAHVLLHDKQIIKQDCGEEIDIVDALPEVELIIDADTLYFPCRVAAKISTSLLNHKEDSLCTSENGVLLLSRKLNDLTLKERLEIVIPEMIELGWCKGFARDLLNKVIDTGTAIKRKKVKDRGSISERLLEAVGSQVLIEKIRQHIEDDIEIKNPIKAAEIALAQFGTAVLSVFRGTLDSNGLNPPSSWNTDEARKFVTEIGFPLEFAASSQQKREAEELISGPLHLPPLHDFQEEVMNGLRDIIPDSKFRRRAVVSLPTGGGKTRVTVQAAVELVLEPNNSNRSVIWIAQTDELCEQAVQAFRQVWVNLGAQGEDLRIVRLWGGQRNPEAQRSDKPLVVVASIQTLNNRFGVLDWLSMPGLVVMDECHHAITPSYTNTFNWLNADTIETKREKTEEPPIIGLSATPFRTNDEESSRLAKRFDNRWFPNDQNVLYDRLLRQEVLSRIKTDALDSHIPLTPEELNKLEELSEKDELDKPSGVNALLSIDNRFANIEERNMLIVDRIKKALMTKEASSILLYANSVHHARKLSVLLNIAGISASSIDGETPRNARRYFLEKFQHGEIKVLCNHSVLTTGFDAPKTDMIMISRMLFSPVMYMQIVGRGLRGPKNGGTPECLLVTVKDNMGRFADRYAYHYCENYFNRIQNKA
jgi:superfamily II DNA or RNA helicase